MNTRKIYIPLFISKFNRTLDEDFLKYSCAINESSVRKKVNVDFDMIATRIRTALTNDPTQVGLDEDDLSRIIDQHSYEKHFNTLFYKLEAIVAIDDLGGPATEAEMYNASENWINVNRNNKFLYLRKHTHFSSSNIQKITLSDLNDKIVFHNQVINVNANPGKIYSSKNARESFKSMLNDVDFWNSQVEQNSIDFIPPGIQEMQDSLKKDPEIDLNKIREIATKHRIPEKLTEDTITFFSIGTSKMNLINQFYVHVSSAQSLNDINDWINPHYEKSQYKSLRKSS